MIYIKLYQGNLEIICKITKGVPFENFEKYYSNTFDNIKIHRVLPLINYVKNYLKIFPK